MSEPRVEHIGFAALDGYRLAATLHHPDDAPRAAVLIASATAVRRGFYARFAGYLTSRGALVMTFDYRGIGDSAPARLRGFEAPMRDWGLKDIPAAMDRLRGLAPHAPLMLVGHSFGAQALALTDRNVHVARALMVAAMTGHWRNFAGLEGYRVLAMTHGPGKLMALLAGYVPGRYGLGEDLARSTFEEWMRWCRDPDYFFGDETLPETRRAEDFTGDILVVNATDDPWTTERSTAALLDHFPAADKRVDFVRPADLGIDTLGHFGFFRSARRDPLWTNAADWLLADL